ncbi:bifunctional 4-hydroxy-2-oxoglutarate aldolase/2-dehydro-3-deoxy-phosphogluconate aldolase [Bacillus horti]
MNGALRIIEQNKIIAIIRSVPFPVLEKTVQALHAGGIRVIEVTMNSEDALSSISFIKAHFPDMVIGAGTVLDQESASLAIRAGASFLLAPNLSESVIQTANRYQIPVIPGVFTPTEIIKASELGAQVVKVFPVSGVGPAYIKDLQGPIGYIKMIPVGGVTLENAAQFMEAGAFALGIGSALTDQQLLATNRFSELKDRAAEFVRIAESFNK